MTTHKIKKKMYIFIYCMIFIIIFSMCVCMVHVYFIFARSPSFLHEIKQKVSIYYTIK